MEWHPICRRLWDSVRGRVAAGEALSYPGPGPSPVDTQSAEAVERLPDGLRDKARSRQLLGRRGCNCRKAACRKCGRMPLRPYLDAWRSSYEPPVRGHRHYRWIVYKRIVEKRIRI